MTGATRAYVFAGITALAVINPAVAWTQACPDLHNSTCRDSGVLQPKPNFGGNVSSNSEIRRGMKQTRRASSGKPLDSKSRQTQASRPARPAKLVTQAQSGDPSTNRRVHGPGEGTRVNRAMTEQEKEVLFQEFLEWEKNRLNTEIKRDR
jgi:hypothetical protein